jgi:trehalose 6-phosphate synthase
MDKAEILVASNRGPATFTLEESSGRLRARRGGGGLVSGLSAVSSDSGTETLWVCAALSDLDREAARSAPQGRLDLAGHDLGAGRVRMLDISPQTFANAYTTVANSVLWFVHHMMYDTPNSPTFDTRFQEAWADYVRYNESFCEALATGAAENAKVLVQDYHLSLVPRMLRDRRPDLRIAHFSHTPWAPPEYFRMLPRTVARELLEGMLGADYLGFLSPRWAEAFLECCSRIVGADVDRTDSSIGTGGRRIRIGVHALGADSEGLRERAAHQDVAERRAVLQEQVGERRLIVRVDRTELSKNIVRGLEAYRELLIAHPEWHGRVVHMASAYPSRTDVAEYRDYTDTVLRLGKEINEEFATAEWTPLIMEVQDDFARSLAAYQRADVLLVNPIRDGMNLVAKEGPVLSGRDSVLVLSTEAGAADELGEQALLVNPYDVTETAETLHRALTMPDEERRRRREHLAHAAATLPPQRWFADQLRALG